MSPDRTRRRFLQAAGATTVASLAGCAGDSGSATDTDSGGSGATPTQTANQSTMESVTVDEEWRRHRVDLANTGSTTNTGPSGDVEVRWTKSVTDGVEGAPVLADGTLFFGSFGDGSLYAVDAATGETVWENQLDMETHVGPTVADDVVLFCNFTTVRALDVETGENRWTYNSNLAFETTPLVADGTVYVGEGSEDLHAVDLESGEQQWTAEYAGSVIDPLAYADGVVYVASHTHVHAVDVTEPEFLWTMEVPSTVNYGATYADGTVFVQADELHAVDSESGDLAWSSDGLDTPAGVVAVRDGTVYTGNSDREVALDAADGTELWTQEIDEGERHVVSDDALYVTTGDGLAALDAETGETRWTGQSNGFPNTHPVLASDLAFLGDSKGITAFQSV